MSDLPYLKLVHSRQDSSTKPGGVEIYCGTDTTSSPFPIDVQVVEEDTWQVLSADNKALEIDEHPIRLMTSLIDQQPLSVGQLVIDGNRWQAVIMDIDQDPVCRREWIIAVYQQIVEQVMTEHIGGISMPLLGVRHDCVSLEESMDILVNSIRCLHKDSSLRIWLKLPEQSVPRVDRLLDKLSTNLSNDP